jgi:hypothetical protein
MVNILERGLACAPHECSLQTIHDVACDVLATNEHIDNAFNYICWLVVMKNVARQSNTFEPPLDLERMGINGNTVRDKSFRDGGA